MAHYCALQGVAKVPSLGDHELLSNQPYGTLAMPTTAVFLFFTHLLYAKFLIHC